MTCSRPSLVERSRQEESVDAQNTQKLLIVKLLHSHVYVLS